MKSSNVNYLIPALIIIALALLSAGILAVYPKKSKLHADRVPEPKRGHPRLLVTKKDQPGIMKKLTTEELKDAWQQVLKESRLHKSSNDSEDLRKSFEANAFIYLVHGSRQNGRTAVELAKRILNTEHFKNHNLSKHELSNKAGRLMLGGAFVYDWCYSLMDNEERQDFVNQFERLAGYLGIGYPPRMAGSITGHSSEAMLMRDLLGTGIAIYDEKKEMYELAAEMFLKEYVPARKLIYQSGMHHQGSSYGPFRYEHEIFATWLFDKIGHPKIFGEDQGKIPYRWIYSRRPDGQFVRDGDDFFSAGWYDIGEYWNIPRAMLMTYSYFKDPILKFEFIKEKEYLQGNIRGHVDPILEIIFANVGVENESVEHLPLTRYFGSPIGSMIARTGWEEGITAASAVAEMKIQEYSFNNHSHMDAGGFQLYYKGALAIDSGIYRNYGSSHDENYYKRTIAHNCLLVHDPQEIFAAYGRSVANDGGQRWPNNKSEPRNLEELEQKGYKQTQVLKHSSGPDRQSPDYSYLKGDLTGAYSDKVENVQRAFVFLNLKNETYPAALIVFDRIIASCPEFKKHWLLHSVQEPELKEDGAVIKRDTDGYNGRLLLKTLLPAKDNLLVKKVGGPGREYEVFGTNYPPDAGKISVAAETGDWRLEVSPKKAFSEDLFLNVMYVSDADKTEIPTPQIIEAPQMIGSMVEDRLVMFSRSGAPIVTEVSYSVEAEAENVKYLITDLSEGIWLVKTNGSILPGISRVKREEGTLYFEAPPGEVELKPLKFW